MQAGLSRKRPPAFLTCSRDLFCFDVPTIFLKELWLCLHAAFVCYPRAEEGELAACRDEEGRSECDVPRQAALQPLVNAVLLECQLQPMFMLQQDCAPARQLSAVKRCAMLCWTVQPLAPLGNLTQEKLEYLNLVSDRRVRRASQLSRRCRSFRQPV